MCGRGPGGKSGQADRLVADVHHSGWEARSGPEDRAPRHRARARHRWGVGCDTSRGRADGTRPLWAWPGHPLVGAAAPAPSHRPPLVSQRPATSAAGARRRSGSRGTSHEVGPGRRCPSDDTAPITPAARRTQSVTLRSTATAVGRTGWGIIPPDPLRMVTRNAWFNSPRMVSSDSSLCGAVGGRSRSGPLGQLRHGGCEATPIDGLEGCMLSRIIWRGWDTGGGRRRAGRHGVAFSAGSPTSATPQTETLTGSCSGADAASARTARRLRRHLNMPFQITSDVPAQLDPGPMTSRSRSPGRSPLAASVTTQVAAIDRR